jgi:hypothetical protein
MPPAWTDASYKMSAKLEVQWDGSNWDDESANLLAASGKQAMLQLWQMAGGVAAQPPWDASFAMSNASDRYTATNTSSAIYSYISDNKGHGIAIRFSVGIDNGAGGFTYTQIFTGKIDRIDVISTRNDRATFTCVDNSHPLLQDKKTTTMYLNQYASDWLTVLASEGGVASTDFDDGLFEIPFCWLDDENLWTEMCKVAYADGGWIFFDRTGTLTFENAEAWAADSRHNSSQHTFTVSRVNDFNLAFLWQDVYNEVIVEYAPRVQRGQVVLYELDEVVTVLPGDTRDITARLRYPAASINAPVANTDYWIISNSGEDLSGDVSISITKYAQRVEVEFISSHAYHVAYIDSIRLTGRPLVGYRALQEKLQATDSDIGDPTSSTAKTLRIAGNEYVQTLEQARFLTQILRDRTKKARQIYVATGVPAIPTLQPGDLVTAVESGSELNHAAYLTSIAWRYGGGKYRADYEMLDATNWYLYSDYFTLGTDTLTNPSERVFY